MSVVGIDIGYQSCFVSIARHGGVETITNEYSERGSPSLVGFSSTMRTMGTTAKTQVTTNFKNTIGGFKTLMGRRYSDPLAQDELSRQHYHTQQLSNDQLGIKVQYLDEEHIFSPSQIMSMMLGYLKGISTKALAKPASDCVIAVPSYFTDAQRRAVLDASSIAGLNCLRLMNETTAVALAYGIYKQDLPEEKEKSRNVVFVDMGHHSLQVAVCAFNKGKLKVLSKSFDPLLGGRDFDRRLVEHFAKEFKKNYNIDVLSKSKATIRLTAECEKLKKLMSANSTSIPINIECFMDDKDVSGRFKRSDFEELCSDLLARVKDPLVVALNKSGLKLEDIHSVEVVGGCIRVPAIKDIIASVFQKEIKTTMNLDEAVARGCALQCAILSPTFKVRDFSIHDIQPYPVKLNWDNNGEPGEMLVFKEGDQIYHSKLLTFYRKDDFTLTASYQNPAQVPYNNPFIGTFRVKGVKPNEEGESSKLKIKVRMSIHGTFIIKSAVMVEKQTVEEAVEVMETDTNVTVKNDTKNDTQEKTEQPTTDGEPTTDGAPPTEDTMETTQSDSQTPTDTESNTETQTNSEATPNSDTTDTATAKQPSPKKIKKTFKQIDLPIDEETHSVKKKFLDEAFEKECKMSQQDRLEIEKTESKNNLEEYVYEIRDKIGSTLEQFISEEAKESFQSLLSATEDWLYDEGEDQPKKVYVERLNELKKIGDPVVEREKESVLRPGAYDLLGRTVVHYEKIVTAYDAGDEKYDHLKKEDIDKVKETIETKRQWLTNQMQLSAATPLCIDPPVKAVQIQTTIKDMNSVCHPIVSKPKPKVEPPKDEGKNEEMEADDKKQEQTEKPEEQPATTTSEGPTGNSGPLEDMDVD